MLYTIAFDSSGAPVQRAYYQPAAAAPSPLPAGERECTAEQFAAWMDYVLVNNEIVILDEPTRQQRAREGLVTRLCSEIDAAADNARRVVAGDPLRAVEYDRAASEAQVFKDTGYPADAVPRTVAAWAINGRTAQQAADSILVEAAQYNEALYLLRETRLQAKELVRQAMAAGNVDQAQDITAETIASIQAAVAGVGNAGIQA